MATLGFASLLIALACSCTESQPAFWIPKLDLPPGVRIVSRAEKDGVLTVSFSTPEEWPAVKAFISDSLSQSGYHEVTHESEIKAKIKTKHPDWDGAQVESRYQKIKSIVSKAEGSVESQTVQYTKPNSCYVVLLLNAQGFNNIAAATAKAEGKSPPPSGGYSLSVFTQEAWDKMYQEYGSDPQESK